MERRDWVNETNEELYNGCASLTRANPEGFIFVKMKSVTRGHGFLSLPRLHRVRQVLEGVGVQACCRVEALAGDARHCNFLVVIR